MKIFALILGLACYILIVSNTHLIGLRSLFKGDHYEFAQAAISIGACGLFVSIQKLFKSPTALSYFRGFNFTHVAVFLLTTTISLNLLSIELDFVYLIVTVLIFAIIEQCIVFAQIALFYGTKKFFFVFGAVYLIFMFGHGLTFNIHNVVSTLFLIPTLYRTIVDRNIWHGVVFHYTYNVGIMHGLEEDPYSDLWLTLLLLYWLLLIFTADNAKPAAARMLSRVFRGRIGARIAALLTVISRLPLLLMRGVSQPVAEYIKVRDSIRFQAEVRTQK